MGDAQEVLSLMMTVSDSEIREGRWTPEFERMNGKPVNSLGPRMEIRVPNRPSFFFTSEIRRRVPEPK